MATEAAAPPATRTLPGPRSATTTPDIRPRAGHELLLGVDKVLAGLTAPGDTLGLADDLRTALARTAALGDSCRVRPQCDDVRLAADLLQTGDVAGAQATLVRVRTELADRQRR
jgi:hypothetical protein